MKSKYYFQKFSDGDHEEYAYEKSHFIEMMKENDLTEIEVYPAIMMRGETYAWCSEYNDAVETNSGDCGKCCEFYKPRNGKNGRCRFSRNCYEPTDESIILKLKQKI